MKYILSRISGNLPKRLAAGAIIALAAALPIAASADGTVALEGTMGVANVTAGDTRYAKSINARHGQIVKVEVYYHNKENPDSGKIAQNLRVKIDLPATAGKSQIIKNTVAADNSNTVNSQVAVNLDRADAYLQYIPGSAVWKHNMGDRMHIQYKEDKLSDAIVNGGQGLVLENEKPSSNYSASVTILARVIVPGVKIVTQSEVKADTNKWSNNNTAQPGDTLKYMITYQNTGNTTEKNVVVRDSLPAKMTVVPGTTALYNSANPKGVKLASDNITNGGIVIGNYAPGADGYVVFEAQIPSADSLACGDTEFRNVGAARPEGMSEYYSTATTKVTKSCESTPANPAYSCDRLTVTKTGDRQIEAQVGYTAKDGAKLKSVTYNFGDQSPPLTTDKTTAPHTYPKAADYTASASLVFAVNGKDQAVNSESCTKPVSFTLPASPPAASNGVSGQQIPNTGPGDVVGLFAGASIAGAVGYRLVLARRLSRQD